MKARITPGLISMLVLWAALSLPILTSAEETVVVIANKGAPVDSLSRDEIKKIFLVKKTQWDNGDKIEFVTLKQGPIHNAFLKKFLQKTPSQFQKYFRALVFTGKGIAPRSFDSEAEVVRFVAATKGAFGYVSPAAATVSVKVLGINW
jgi:ABC-type phosphate transport system substrate-binding protein